jgi:hypothetical protein
MKDFFPLITRNWKIAWADKKFRILLIIELILIFTFMISTTFFFDHMESLKEGVVINDWVLNQIPAINVSIPISFLMASSVILIIIRGAEDPNMAIVLILALTFQLVTRIITINLTKFFAPPELIVLKDPIGSFLYHSKFITRDLFYSGHTAAACTFYLFATKRKDKYYLLFCSITVACLLLIQHVHYSIDVALAPFFAFANYWLAKKIVNALNPYVNLN